MATIPLVPIPTAAEVQAYAGTTDARVDDPLSNVIALARGYTRGVGFETAGQCPEDVAAVIVAATVRAVQTPVGRITRQIGDVEITREAREPWGFSLLERLVLDRYRLRSA